MRIVIAAVFVLFALSPALHAQQRQWVYFTDRGPDAELRAAAARPADLGVSPQALARRAGSTERYATGVTTADLPPFPASYNFV